MPCITPSNKAEEAEHFEKLLCQACKFLTATQIDSLLNPESGIYDGLLWYSQHLFLDYCQNPDEKEKLVALNELHRICYDVVACKGGKELVKKWSVDGFNF